MVSGISQVEGMRASLGAAAIEVPELCGLNPARKLWSHWSLSRAHEFRSISFLEGDV